MADPSGPAVASGENRDSRLCDGRVSAPSAAIALRRVLARLSRPWRGRSSATGSCRSVTIPFDLLGLPAISVPCGFSDDGCPIGLQLVGRAFDEVTVLRARSGGGQCFRRAGAAFT